MKNCKKKLLGTLLACIFVSLMINSVINATMNSNFSEADEDIVLNEDNPQQADDFDPPLPPDNDKLKWDFSNGTNLGFHYTWENDTESHAGYNYFNITSMPYLLLDIDEMEMSNFTYCVQLEEIYFNTTENKMMPVNNHPLLNVSLVNVTGDFFGSTGFFFPMIPSGGGGNGPPPGFYFMNINPFIPTNDTILALTWSAERLKFWYENFVEMGELDIATTSIAPNNNNIYFENSTTTAYVNLTYYDNGILKYGEIYNYDDEDGWHTITLTTIFDVNPLDDLEWDVDVGDALYMGISYHEFKFNISKIENITVDFGPGGMVPLQVVWANMSMWNIFTEAWEYVDMGGGINWIIIGSANDVYPFMFPGEDNLFIPLLMPVGFTIPDLANVMAMMGDEDDPTFLTTYGDDWITLSNSSGYLKYIYNASGFVELIDSNGYQDLFGYEEAVFYRKNSTFIDASKIWELEIIPIDIDSSEFNISIDIKVTGKTHLLTSAMNINPLVNNSLGSGILFFDIWVNNTAKLDLTHNAPINITIDYDRSKYKNMDLHWLNTSSMNPEDEFWQVIPFTDYGNGTIVFTVNHTSIFAFSNVISGRGGALPSADDDDDDDEAAAIPIGNYYLIFIAIAVIGLIIYKKREIFKKQI